MENTKKISEKTQLVVLEDYGLPADMRGRLCAYFEREELQSAKALARTLASQLHAAQPSERSFLAQKLIA